MAGINGLDRLLSYFETVRHLNQDMSDYDRWFARRGKKLLQILDHYSENPNLYYFINKYADCLADSILDLLQARAFSAVAETAIDLVEELAAQTKSRDESFDLERAAEEDLLASNTANSELLEAA